MLVISEVWRDPRVEREARALAANGFRVRVVYPDFFSTAPGVPNMNWGEGIEFRALPGHFHSFIHGFPYLLGRDFLAALRDERPFAFHAHDLTTALIGLAAARKADAHCICDFHEWYSENVSWSDRRNCFVPHPWIKKSIYRLAELLVMHRASAVVTVCDSIANDLSSGRYQTRRKVEVIRNIPSVGHLEPTSYTPLRESLALDPDQFILLWQGGTGPTRLIEPIIEALVYAPSVTFVIRGISLELFGEGYQALAQKLGVAGRLVLLPPVPSSDVVAAAVSADAGIWTLPNLCKNFYYALPNKIFEYLAAGLPVLVANFPEARRIVEENDVGLCFDPYDPRSIAAQLNRLSGDKTFAAGLRANIPKMLHKIDADNEWKKLVTLYQSLLSTSRTEAAR